MRQGKVLLVACLQRILKDVNGGKEDVWRTFGGRSEYRKESKHRLNFKKNLNATRYCIARACECTWGDCCGGSIPFFLRWPKENRVTIRDGRTNFVRKPLPKYSVP